MFGADCMDKSRKAAAAFLLFSFTNFVNHYEFDEDKDIRGNFWNSVLAMLRDCTVKSVSKLFSLLIEKMIEKGFKLNILGMGSAKNWALSILNNRFRFGDVKAFGKPLPRFQGEKIIFDRMNIDSASMNSPLSPFIAALADKKGLDISGSGGQLVVTAKKLADLGRGELTKKLTEGVSGSICDFIFDAEKKSIVCAGIEDISTVAGQLADSSDMEIRFNLNFYQFDFSNCLWEQLCKILPIKDVALSENLLPPIPPNGIVPYTSQEEWEQNYKGLAMERTGSSYSSSSGYTEGRFTSQQPMDGYYTRSYLL